MSNAIKLFKRGTYWRDLSDTERIDIFFQMKTLYKDPQHVNYRYYYTPYFKWVIVNAMLVPMKLPRMAL